MRFSFSSLIGIFLSLPLITHAADFQLAVGAYTNSPDWRDLQPVVLRKTSADNSWQYIKMPKSVNPDTVLNRIICTDTFCVAMPLKTYGYFT